MAIKLSNTGIAAGQVVKAAEVSQSVDAFLGTIAYDIHQSGSFNQTGSTILSGSVSLPENTHLGIGAPANLLYPIYIKAQDSSDDPVVLLEGFDIADSSLLGFKNADVRWNIGLFGGSADSFLLQNQETNTYPLLIDYSSSNGVVMRNDDGAALSQRVGINWPYGDLDILTTTHQLNVSGSATASAGFYGDLIGTASVSDKVYVADMIANQTMPLLVKAGGASSQNDYNNVFSDPLTLNWNNVEFILETTASWASHSISSSYSETASYALTAESSNPLWYDSTVDGITPAYISSSVIVSSSDFTGKLGNINKINSDEVSSSLHIGDNFSGSEFTASNATLTATLGPNDLRFDRDNVSYISQQNVGTSAELALGVGGSGNATNTAISINNHNELTAGSPKQAMSYPLGYAAGEIASYMQMQYDHQNSASVLALKGKSGGDGIVYLGGNEEYGGGQLFHGGVASGTKVPSRFENGNTSLYRVSKSVAFPILDYPTDNNQINVTLSDRDGSEIDNLDFFGVGQRGFNEAFKRTYHLHGKTTTNTTPVSLGEVTGLAVGTYVVKFHVNKIQNQSPPGLFCTQEIINCFYVDTVGGNPVKMVNGSTPDPVIYQATEGIVSISQAIVVITNGFQFRSTGNVGANIIHNGWAEIIYCGSVVTP